MTTAREVMDALAPFASPDKAAHLCRFFKTGPGQYGAGDRFLGITVPEQRKVGARFRELSLEGIRELLHSPFHEHRLTALLILVARYQREFAAREEIFRFYLDHLPRVDNWDLVDLSAPKIAGAHVLTHPEREPLLEEWAASPVLWVRRVAILATWPFTRAGRLDPLFGIAERLLADREDLMHKAVGWMLREGGKVDGDALTAFLARHGGKMARTTLRYAIERFAPEERRRHLVGS